MSGPVIRVEVGDDQENRHRRVAAGGGRRHCDVPAQRTAGFPTRPKQAFTPRTGASDAERIADLEKALAAQVDRGNLLDSRLKELETGRWQLAAIARNCRWQRPARATSAWPKCASGCSTRRQRQHRSREDARAAARAAAGPPGAGRLHPRARRVDRAPRSRNCSCRPSRPSSTRSAAGQQVRGADTDAALRKEMGDAEYEKYLTGTGRPTEVRVMDVLASSPAEKAGLRPGDQIVSYAGTRVFDDGRPERADPPGQARRSGHRRSPAQWPDRADAGAARRAGCGRPAAAGVAATTSAAAPVASAVVVRPAEVGPVAVVAPAARTQP